MNKPVKYVCPKCGSKNFTTGTIWASRSIIAKLLDIQDRRYTTVTCSVCQYTELYHLHPKRLGEVLEHISNKSTD
jgi:predicted nucleic-acid-binding Zn-ribbon protein